MSTLEEMAREIGSTELYGDSFTNLEYVLRRGADAIDLRPSYAKDMLHKLAECQTGEITAALSGSPQVEAGTVEAAEPIVDLGNVDVGRLVDVLRNGSFARMTASGQMVATLDPPIAADVIEHLLTEIAERDAKARTRPREQEGGEATDAGRLDNPNTFHMSQPFERVPTHAGDPGFGPIPPETNVVHIDRDTPSIPREQNGGEAPVAWLQEHPEDESYIVSETERLIPADEAAGWKETPLYRHPAPLPADGWKEGIEAAAKVCQQWLDNYSTLAIDHSTPREYATGAVLDIKEVIEGLLPTPPASTEGGADA